MKDEYSELIHSFLIKSDKICGYDPDYKLVINYIEEIGATLIIEYELMDKENNLYWGKGKVMVNIWEVTNFIFQMLVDKKTK